MLGGIFFSQNWSQGSTWHPKFRKLPEFGAKATIQLPMQLVPYHPTPIASIDKEAFEGGGGHLLIKTGFPFPVDMLNFSCTTGAGKEPSLTLPFPSSISWDHLLNKLLTSKCLSLGLLSGEPKPRLWKHHYELYTILCFI